jgi:hypothetical protein
MIDSKTTVKNIRQFIKEYGASRYRLLALAFLKVAHIEQLNGLFAKAMNLPRNTLQNILPMK